MEAGGKNSPGQPTRPSEPHPRPGPGLSSRSYSGTWESHTPWRKVPSHPPPITPFLPPSSSSSSCRSLLSLQRKEGRVEWENQEGRGWGGQGVSRAGSLMPATPGQVQ